jgi:hypothetical protein
MGLVLFDRFRDVIVVTVVKGGANLSLSLVDGVVWLDHVQVLSKMLSIHNSYDCVQINGRFELFIEP